jgi:ornithine cyclodeaminase/alanine dehydrogenase-like protein (mu-crystallin family)
MQIHIKDLVKKLEEIFINEQKFQMVKRFENFNDNDGKFGGDVLNMTIWENVEGRAPIIYSISGPYDLVSNKSCQKAIVWQDGKELLDVDYTEYAAIRTGIMDSLVISHCGVTNFENKKILFFGTGKTAQWSLKGLKEMYPELSQIFYINSKNSEDLSFINFASELKVEALVGNKRDLSSFDFIFCHTNTKESILTDEDLTQIKEGAIITAYISSTEHGEVCDNFYNTNNANIIVDWDKNIDTTHDLQRAVESGIANRIELILLKDLIAKKRNIDESKKYTLFRSHGTPMQNLAMLKILSTK